MSRNRCAIVIDDSIGTVISFFYKFQNGCLRVLISLLAVATPFVGAHIMAAPPELYRQAAYESPVRGDPDDLLLLAGYGFAADDEVVYRAIRDTSQQSTVPTSVPSQSTAEFGLAPIVSSADVPYSLTVKLPQLLRVDQSYALWVHTSHGEWSRPVFINDARPLWITPAYAYATAPVGSLPRELKVIGRNLQAGPAQSTQIRLIGPQRYAGKAVSDESSSPTMNRYVARMQLPDSILPGHYRIEISRDGTSWLEVHGQSLEVLPDPPLLAKYFVSDPQFGGCRPDDETDDTACIVRAIAAATRAGGGSVVFGPGTWDLVDSGQPGVVAAGGIVVPAGVQIRGAGSDLSTIQKHPEWNAQRATAAFTLVGHTVVTGFRFRDTQIYQPRDTAGPFLQVGENFQRAASNPHATASAALADDIVITHNIFDKTMVAIADGGLPINRLFITYNTFGAYLSALELGGNRFNMRNKYRIADSVIDHNTFQPSSELDVVGKTGAIASEIGGGYRLDFSDNTADGSSTKFLYSSDDPRGWRAAFFWNLNGNVEEALIAHNTATCTGDKIGDGEAIAFDNNANTFAFTAAASVMRATLASVAVSAPLALRQNDRDVPLASYYVGHWVQIASGPGLGQVRKITGYSTDPITRITTFQVAPNWDVVPVAGKTRVAVGREFWQVYTIENRVDHRRPLCQKSNRSRHDGGVIGLWAQSADSVIEGNLQFDSDGILFQQAYLVPEHPCADCTMQSFFQSFLDIRSNTIDGEYDWTTDCSSSGIVAGIAAAPWNDSLPPTVGFGVTISHNTIKRADAPHGGAIAQVDSWYAGPEPHRWPLSDNMLIHHNSLQDIDGARALPLCGTSHPRIGINFPQPDIAWRTVLYANSCTRVSQPLGSGGVQTTRVCPSSATPSCECP